MTITAEEKARIQSQSWEGDEVLGGRALFRKGGPIWARRDVLNHREDGSCVFLSETGRCRIHERFGYAAKPLPCRLFPFVLVPAGDHWRVGLRFACPSTAANKGRSVPQHAEALRAFADELAARAGLDKTPNRKQLPPRLQRGQRVDWADVFRFVQTLVQIVRDPEDRFERRIRKCVALADLCRKARFEQVKGARLGELLQMLRITIDAEVPEDPTAVAPPRWIGKLLFRQAVALFTRKDHGPTRSTAPDRATDGVELRPWTSAVRRDFTPRWRHDFR